MRERIYYECKYNTKMSLTKISQYLSIDDNKHSECIVSIYA